MSPESNISHPRIDEIEVLRGIAIAFTLIHHTAYFLLLRPNVLINDVYKYFTFWGGVDLFFVISGFVIIKSLRRSIKNDSPHVGSWRVMMSFWIKRIWRILPSAWLWIVIFLFASYFFNSTNAFGDISVNLHDSVSWIFQYANYYQYLCSKGEVICGFNGVYWSLSLEEQFYILLPLTILIFRKYFIYALIAIFVPQLLIERPEWSFGWAFRFDTLIWGVLLGLWTEHASYLKFQPRFMKFRLVRWIFVLLLVFGMAFIPAPPNEIPLATSFLGLAALFLVYIASYDKDYLLGPGALRSVMTWLGSRSYSLYLIHIFSFRISYEILSFVIPSDRPFSTADAPYVIAISFPLLFILSELNFRFIETPFRVYGVKNALTYLKRSSKV